MTVFWRGCTVPLLLAIACLAGLNSCKTQDVDPAVQIGVDSVAGNRLSENSSRAYLTATLNGASTKEVRIQLAFAGTATQGADYSVAATEIVVPAGSLKGSVAVASIQDSEIEGDETILVTLTASGNVQMLQPAQVTIIISDDDTDTDEDGVADADDACPTVKGPAASHGCPAGTGLVLNEILYDPADGLAGDANGDGVRDAQQDEFVELVNTAAYAQDIGGFTISDLVIAGGGGVKYTFPAGTTLPAGKAIVVFGGGTPTGTFGGAQVLTCTEPIGLSFGNSGEKVLIGDPDGNVLITFDSDAESNNPDESFTRNPDLTGAFVQHAGVTAGKNFSPGTKTDGTPF